MADLRREGKFNQKKSVSVAAATLTGGSLIKAAEAYKLFDLPEDAVIINTKLYVRVAGDALATMNIGFDGGTGSELGSAIALDSIGVANGTANVVTGSGKTVIVTPSTAITRGEFTVIVEYIEYNKTTGEYTAIPY